MSYLFGRLEGGKLCLQRCNFGPPLAFTEAEYCSHAMVDSLRDLIDSGHFYTRIVLAVPTGAANAKLWSRALRAAGYTRMPTDEVRELVQGFGPVIGPAFHPEQSDLWGYGTLKERVHGTHMVRKGGRFFVEAVVEEGGWS